MGGKIVHSVGLVRAKAKIGMMNLVYKMSRLVRLQHVAAALQHRAPSQSPWL